MPDQVQSACRREPIPEELRERAPARRPQWDPTCGIPVGVSREGEPPHRLVTIGDSLTHGFQSGAIFNTDLSYPALIARELGWGQEFRYPSYPGYGGIPLNIELIVRELEEGTGDEISPWEWPAAIYRVRQHLAEAERWWSTGPGSVFPPDPDQRMPINHNLGIYGWDIRDALDRTPSTSKSSDRVPERWWSKLVPLVRNADHIAAKRVLWSATGEDGRERSPVAAAEVLGTEGIETLIVMLGANNALGSVIGLEVRWSGDDYRDLAGKAKYNVWRPEHFAAELDELVARVRGIGARHVIWSTVPHVTIAPVARGVGGKVEPGSRYFRYYARPWIDPEDFDPGQDCPYLTADDARAVDRAIDLYDEAIVAAVEAARRDGLDWRLFDLAGLLDRLALRRYFDPEDPADPPDWLEPYELPPALANLDVPPDSRFFASGPDGRTAGGLFSLDGIHPTTVAYGLMAQELIGVMQGAGVKFLDGAGAERDEVSIDFERLIALDTLISQPPRSLSENVELIGWLDERIDVIGRLWAGIA